MIAFDNQISKQTVRKLSEHFSITFHAEDQPDDVWVDESLRRGAMIFVSPDLDIPLLLDKVAPDCIWIDIPQGCRNAKQFTLLFKRLTDLKNKGIIR